MKSSEFLKEIRGLSQEDLRKKARELAEELMKLRFRKASGQLEQGHLLSEVQRNLARVKTVLNSQQESAKA